MDEGPRRHKNAKGETARRVVYDGGGWRASLQKMPPPPFLGLIDQGVDQNTLARGRRDIPFRDRATP
jgi:hypothetical protein